MQRLVITGAIVLAVGFVLTTELALGAGGPPAPTHAYLENFACHRALDPSRRIVSVTAVMHPVPGTERLRMRFQLLGDAAGQVVPVRAGDLGTWISPHPITLGQQPADVWIVHHPVSGIAVPAAYHFRVSFRWTDSNHRVIGSVVRLSATCWEPDMRPDLLVQSIKVYPVTGVPSEDQYNAVIANNGLTAAKDVGVLFAPAGGGADQMVTIAKLRPRTKLIETFLGPACTPADDPTVTVDPGHHMSDLNPANNSLTATCPAQKAASPS